MSRKQIWILNTVKSILKYQCKIVFKMSTKTTQFPIFANRKRVKGTLNLDFGIFEALLFSIL